MPSRGSNSTIVATAESRSCWLAKPTRMVPELIVPAVHRVAVHTDNFRTRRRRYVRTKASDNLPVFCALNLLYFIDFHLPVSGDANQEPSKKSWLENSKRDSCLNCPKIWGQFRPVEGVSS